MTAGVMEFRCDNRSCNDGTNTNLITNDAQSWSHGESVFSTRIIAPAETIRTPAPIGIPLNTKPSDKTV